MKHIGLVFLFLLGVAASALAQTSDDPLLDAKLDLARLRMRYAEAHPRILEAEARFEILSKTTPASTPAEYLLHIQERLTLARAEDTALSLRYLEQHPRRVSTTDKIKVLLQELERAQQTKRK